MAGDGSDQRALQYEQTLLGVYTKEEATPLRESRPRRSLNERSWILERLEYDKGRRAKCHSCMVCCQKILRPLVTGEWFLIILLGFFMGLISWLVDLCVDICQHVQHWIYSSLDSNVYLQYLAWVTCPVALITFAAGFTQILAPHAIGSGIPEMKTILRGVMLKEQLTLKTFVSKVISLTCVLGSGMPLGKESPFVHIGALCAALLSKVMSRLGGNFEDKSKNIEILAAACGVGVSACFASPIGGVLYSIELTSKFFPVRNYWRSFLVAFITAFIYRLLPVWNSNEETITALYRTSFRLEFTYGLRELPAFAVIGIVCGFMGILYVYLNRVIVQFIKKYNIFATKRLLYASVVTFVISTLTFPPGFGQFMAGSLTQTEALVSCLDNQTWAKQGIAEEFEHGGHEQAWIHPQVSVFVVLGLFFIMKFLMTTVGFTMPVPCGAFMPSFVIGAGFGRLVGEGMAAWFPDGVHADGIIYPIVPGGYAVVGAAALSGAVTHTVSPAVMVLEMTGQISHIVPVIIAVILANIVTQSLQPSLYDSLIRVKKLPYLTELGRGHRKKNNIHVEDFMERDVRYITLNCCYRDLHNILLMSQLKTLALVESAESMILLGSIKRAQLQSLLSQKLGRTRRLQNIREWAAEEKKCLSTPSNSASDDNSSQQTSQEVLCQIYSDESSISSTRPVLQKPLKPALKRPSVVEQHTELPTDNSGIALKNVFRSSPDAEALEDDGDVEDDTTIGEIEEWEERQLDEQVNFNNCKIDPAPFQLLERTSLHKTHTIFSLLGLDHAYVTSIGRLIGVVSLKELRKAIEDFVSVNGITMHPPLANFLYNDTSSTKNETIELHKLLDCYKSILLPCESTPSESEAKPH